MQDRNAEIKRYRDIIMSSDFIVVIIISISPSENQIGNKLRADFIVQDTPPSVKSFTLPDSITSPDNIIISLIDDYGVIPLISKNNWYDYNNPVNVKFDKLKIKILYNSFELQLTFYYNGSIVFQCNIPGVNQVSLINNILIKRDTEFEVKANG